MCQIRAFHNLGSREKARRRALSFPTPFLCCFTTMHPPYSRKAAFPRCALTHVKDYIFPYIRRGDTSHALCVHACGYPECSWNSMCALFDDGECRARDGVVNAVLYPWHRAAHNIQKTLLTHYRYSISHDSHIMHVWCTWSEKWTAEPRRKIPPRNSCAWHSKVRRGSAVWSTNKARRVCIPFMRNIMIYKKKVRRVPGGDLNIKSISTSHTIAADWGQQQQQQGLAFLLLISKGYKRDEFKPFSIPHLPFAAYISSVKTHIFHSTLNYICLSSIKSETTHCCDHHAVRLSAMRFASEDTFSTFHIVNTVTLKIVWTYSRHIRHCFPWQTFLICSPQTMPPALIRDVL